jgi:hypothetical protein
VIAIIGMGAVGTYLASVLIENGQHVVSLDYRCSSVRLETRDIWENEQHLQVTYENVFLLDPGCQLIIVSCKSMDINVELIDALISEDTYVLFIQNGISNFSYLSALSDKFLFGTLAGFESRREGSLVRVFTNNPSLSLHTRIPELASLFQSLSQDTFLFQNLESLHSPLVSKFPRWFISSAIMMLGNGPLGISRLKLPPWELTNACKEVASYMKLLFGVDLDEKAILEEVWNLPDRLTTSAFRDYGEGKANEWTIEWASAVESLSKQSLNSKTLELWGERILNG